MISPTERLHYADSFLLSFDATVVARAAHAGKPSVVLDRSAFFPEGGGQLGDRGTLAIGGRDVVVTDVQVDDAGVVHHLVDDVSTVEVGASAKGSIERARRRIHMSLHTAQHILSAAFADDGAPTVSARLGDSTCTIDLGGVTLGETAVARAEALANAIIDDDLAIRAWFPEPGELETIALRRKPKVEKDVRVVMIGDFDASPCGGTHCARSSQVGLVAVTGLERYKGGTRITFSAGSRARAELGADAGALRTLSREMSCGPSDVARAIEKLRKELQETREAFGRARGEIAVRLADELVAAAKGPIVVATVDDPEMLRAVLSRITSSPERVALLAARADDGLRIAASRGAASTFDCGGFLRDVTKEAGGKGGGRPEHAEGKLPPDADWSALARAALAARGIG